MRKLISLIVTLLAIVAVVYLVTMVPMGKKTLWQHLKSIADTEASKDMVEGVKETAQEVIKKTTAPEDKANKKSKDELTPEDRKKLRRLLKKLDSKDGDEKKGEGAEKKSKKEAEAEGAE